MNLSDLETQQSSAIATLRSDLAEVLAVTTETAELCATRETATQDPAQIAASSTLAEKLVVGGLESIWVEDLQLALPARIDTGAETASLDARNITTFERDGKPWVRFEIPHPAREEALTLERPRVRQALVVQASSAEPERRPVIELGIQVGPVRQLAEFTLSNRSHLDFQMLVGRNILRDVMVVDVSQQNLVPLPVSESAEAALEASTKAQDEEAP